ncbi:MAG: restriction endonuclease subunit S [Bacillota bacterium]
MAVWSSVVTSKLTEDLRLDAEYYRPEYLAQDTAVGGVAHEPLANLAGVSDGNHVSIAESFSDQGVRYLRGQDLSDFFINDKDPKYVPEPTYRSLRRSHMKPGDVLVGIVATIGTVSLVTDRFDKLTGNCKIGILRPRSIEPEYLAVYLASAVGQREIRRRVRGTVQTGIVLPDLKNLPIAILSDEIRNAVMDDVVAAMGLRNKAQTRYAEAEALMESALGFGGLDLSQKLFYQRSYGDAQAFDRLDAEYFQPAKKVVLDALEGVSGTAIGAIYQVARQVWMPAKKGGLVRNYDLSAARQPFLDDTVLPVSPDEVDSAKVKLRPGDLVVSRLRSYLKEIAVVTDTGNIPMVGSTEFIVLRSKAHSVSPEVLGVYLRSPYVQTVLRWCQDGSNHPRFDQKELLSLRIPDAVLGVQDAIDDCIQTSIAAHRESRRRLNQAKKTVEDAILRAG